VADELQSGKEKFTNFL